MSCVGVDTVGDGELLPLENTEFGEGEPVSEPGVEIEAVLVDVPLPVALRVRIRFRPLEGPA